MKNSLLLTLIAVLLISAGVYVYIQNKQTTTSTTKAVLSDIKFIAGSGESIVLTVGQSANDDQSSQKGVRFTLSSLSKNSSDSSGAPLATIYIASDNGGSYSTTAGGQICWGHGCIDPNSSTGGISITVLSISLEANTATILVNTASNAGGPG